SKVIYDTFRRRQLPSFPALAVDVYINDGRNGGYGSLTGNDLFTEKLILDNYWSTQDLWVKVVPYASDADQQPGDPGDQVEPPAGRKHRLPLRPRKEQGRFGFGFGHGEGLSLRSDHRIGLAHRLDAHRHAVAKLRERTRGREACFRAVPVDPNARRSRMRIRH